MGMELERANTTAEAVESSEAPASPEQNLPASLQVSTLPKVENTSSGVVPSADLDEGGFTFSVEPAEGEANAVNPASKGPNKAGHGESRGHLGEGGAAAGDIRVHQGAPAGFDEKHPETLRNAVPTGKEPRNRVDSAGGESAHGKTGLRKGGAEAGSGHGVSEGQQSDESGLHYGGEAAGDKKEPKEGKARSLGQQVEPGESRLPRGGNNADDTAPDAPGTFHGKDLGKNMKPQPSPESQQQFMDLMRKFKNSIRLL